MSRLITQFKMAGNFDTRFEFVYVWDKILNGRLPREIAGVIGHTEENLKPFCTHLEQMHDRLRSKIS